MTGIDRSSLGSAIAEQALWIIVILPAFLLASAVPTAGQLAGTWHYTSDGCVTDEDGNVDCGSEEGFVVVTQNGNRLSASYSEPAEIPPGCTATCTPSAPICALPYRAGA